MAVMLVFTAATAAKRHFAGGHLFLPRREWHMTPGQRKAAEKNQGSYAPHIIAEISENSPCRLNRRQQINRE